MTNKNVHYFLVAMTQWNATVFLGRNEVLLCFFEKKRTRNYVFTHFKVLTLFIGYNFGVDCKNKHALL